MSDRRERDSLNDYALFYEKIGNGKAAATQERKDAKYDKDPCLNEDQVAKLSEDLEAPLSNKNRSNPIEY